MAIFDWIFEIGAVRRNANLVDLEKCSKMSIYLQKSAFIDSISVLLENESGVDTAENEPPQVWGVIQFNIQFGP